MADSSKESKKVKENIIVVPEKELAEYLGVSERRIRQMVKEGLVEKVGANKFDLKKSVILYIDFLKRKENAKDQNLEKIKIAREAEGLMHDKLKKRKTELLVNQMEKELHVASDVEYFWNAIVLAAKTRLLSIPVKASPVLIGLDDKMEIQTILRREITDALNELSNYDVSMFDKDYEDDEDATTSNEIG